MNWFNNASIRVKLILIMILTAMLALFLATSAVVINEYFSKKTDTEKQLSLIGDVVAWNAAAALMFDDVATAQEMLKGLHILPSLQLAELYKRDAKLFAEYQQYTDNNLGWDAQSILPLIKAPPTPTLTSQLLAWLPAGLRNELTITRLAAPIMTSSGSFSSKLVYRQHTLHLFRPIIQDGELQGILHLVDDQSGLNSLLQRFYLIITLILVITTISILVISTKLQQVFLSPLLRLMHAMRLVSEHQDFTRSVSKTSNDEFGELAAVYNTMLTEIQLRDQALIRHKNDLEQQVLARTQELSEKNTNLNLAIQEALAAKEQAEAASKAKSQFLATMSHEIRTPMNGVLGMTELLINSELNSRQKHLAETAYRSAESLLGIINNILDYSKIEASKFQLSLAYFDLRALLEETVEILATQAHQKQLELVLKLPIELSGNVYGDAERLRQVLVNLVGNAIKFTNSGEVLLKLSFLPESNTEQMQVLFEVIDTGPGIAENQQAIIFDSFTQADGTITRRHGGTGLGLTISRQLVKLMGGDLQVSSQEGAGAKFYFSLCLPNSQEAIPQKADLSVLSGLEILVVDDNATNREILTEQLNYWGMQATSCVSGAEALNLLDKQLKSGGCFQVIILDWHMPNMDGLMLAKIIHSDPYYQHPLLIMLSSDNIGVESQQEQAYGISFFLTKPVIQQKLLNCLRDAVGNFHAKTNQMNPDSGKSLAVLQNLQILLAEDQPVNQQVGCYMLQELGVIVDIVPNGLQAVAAIAKKTYDLILMDCHMPEMDGFAATRAIRTSSNQRRIPIIALTADVQKGIVAECLDAGMDDYLSKPFSQQQLQKILEKWLTYKYKNFQAAPAELTSFSQAVVLTEYADPVAHSALLNPQAISNLQAVKTAHSESLLVHAITLFKSAIITDLQVLHTALQQQDSEILRRTAHGLKSVTANLGADQLASCCANMEALARQHNFPAIAAELLKFENHLPAIVNALTELSSTDSVTIAAASELLSGNGMHILLVDDDSQFNDITATALISAGFRVDVATNGQQALESIKQAPPDLVLLDAVMDGLTGFETCRLMRNLAFMADLPIIMSTGLGDIDSINEAFAAGATDFVTKPLNFPILIHRLWFIIRASQNTAKLRTSKVQLSAAQRIARLGYWTWDFAHDKFVISENLANMCNINLDTFKQTLDDFISLIHVQDQEFVKSLIQAAAKNDAAIMSSEYRLQASPALSIYVLQEVEAVMENHQRILTGTVQDISLKKQAEWQMHRLAYFDNLTGLASRAYYHERVEDFIRVANRHEQQFAFLFIDLDGFKDINDSFGHDVGDFFLKAIAERIKTVVRDVDFAARLGGDEFCILLDNVVHQEKVAEVAERCLQKIHQTLEINQHQIKPRASIGIAIFPKDGTDEINLLKAADAAMYAAKAAGKQCYMFYSAEMANLAINRLEKEQMIHTAFEQSQFVLHYQPQISLKTGRMVGLEALVRWQHPEQGLISPLEFIPLVEQLGLISHLGNWVLNAACQQIAAWHAAGLPYLRVAVNIAPSHFQEQDLFCFIQELLSQTGVPAQCLELEVTESAMQTAGSLEIFSRLRECGIKIAIDDFGTGYSCLASLKQLPLDYLKVDRIFVADVLTNTHTSLLLGTIIGLANALDYTVIAEGVETREQAIVMHGLGCHIVQGYLFSRPLTSAQIPAILEKDFNRQPED